MAEEPAQDNMLQDAVNAVRDGDKTRAKAILTRLLQADQNNALYWVWMSATVDNNKERIYCLQTALKLDPESSSAKRGLILLGAMPPDENVQPFPLNRPRAWEEKLLLAHEQARPKGASNPYVRLALIVIGVVVVLGFAVSSLLAPRQTVSIFRVFPTNTFGVSPTFTLTPTFVNATGQPISTSHGPTPLAAVFGVSYTATPLYVNTPRAPQSLDQYNAALAAYKQGDWTSFIASMQQIEVLEPNAADVPYYIGEAYRLQGDYNDALAAYSQSLHVDPNFAPAYLGSARADLLRDPNANVTKLFAEAIADDPNFGDAYLERANYYLFHNQPDLALSDLDAAGKRMPNSALVQLGYARAYLAQGNVDQGLAAAQKANQIDVTLLPSYLVLGQAYVAKGQCSEAVKPLETYSAYKTNDGGAYALLGQCDEATGDYQSAVDTLSKALSLDPTQYGAYLYRGLSYLELNNIAAADADLRKAIEFFPNSFNANLGILRLSYLEGHYGDAYLHIQPTSALAQTDGQKALVLYWTALIQEKRAQPKEAIAAWQSLLALPADVMTAQMRDDATKHLAALVTATPTPKGGVPAEATNTVTPTPTPTKTP